MFRSFSQAGFSTVLALAVVAFGCASPPPEGDPVAEAARAVGLSDPIRVQSTAGPVDVEGREDRLEHLEAISRALHNSPEVQAALAEVAAALAEARQARILSNPVLDISVRFPTGGGTEIVEAALSQSLHELLTRGARSRATDSRLRAASARVVETALDVLLEVERSYAQAQAADARLSVLGEQAALLDRLVAIAEARRRVGEAGRLDVIGFQARRAALSAEVEQAQADRRSARLTLARLVGTPSAPADWELEEWSPPDLPSASEADWIILALQRRPEAQAAVFELAALGEEVQLASLDSFEELTAGVELESEDDFSVGPAASLPIPLFDLGRNRSALAQAHRLAASHRLTAIRRHIVEEVRQALAARDSASRAVGVVDAQVLPLQRDVVERTQAAYRAGLADVTDLLQAEQDLLDAEAALLAARERLAIAQANLRRAAGGTVTPAPTTTTAPTTGRTQR